MGLLKSFFNQCARPEGSLGRAMLCFMNYTHAPLTNWGLKLVNVQDGWTMQDLYKQKSIAKSRLTLQLWA